MERAEVKIFDTTLRDGEQSPGATMNIEEKILIARQLEKLNVDVIEADAEVRQEMEGAALARLALDPDPAAVCLDDPLGDRQPQARADLVAR